MFRTVEPSCPSDAARRLLMLSVIGLGLAWLAVPGPSLTSEGEVRLRVDPNLAPRRVLLALPGLGPARVAAIESARAASPFRSLADLDRRVKGIGPATAASLEPHLRFPAPQP